MKRSPLFILIPLLVWGNLFPVLSHAQGGATVSEKPAVLNVSGYPGNNLPIALQFAGPPPIGVTASVFRTGTLSLFPGRQPLISQTGNVITLLFPMPANEIDWKGDLEIKWLGRTRIIGIVSGNRLVPAARLTTPAILITPGAVTSIVINTGFIGGGGGDGRPILSGTINPAAETGNIGDFFLNTATNFFYGPKRATGWPVGTQALIYAVTNGISGTLLPAHNAGTRLLTGVCIPTADNTGRSDPLWRIDALDDNRLILRGPASEIFSGRVLIQLYQQPTN